MTRPRSNSGSTVRAPSVNHEPNDISNGGSQRCLKFLTATVSIHDDSVSRECVILSDSFLAASNLADGDLIEIHLIIGTTAARDFQSNVEHTVNHATSITSGRNQQQPYICVVRKKRIEANAKLQDFEISINKHVAAAYDFTSRSQVKITAVDTHDWTASHVEISFRDAYLSRSDMWRLTNQELIGKTLYLGQRLFFFGTLRATVKKIHVHGRHSNVAYFNTTTVPVFRSEAARYLIFVQMSSEMWDFDSEGDGEILFDRVVNGFLPELFKRWSEMEVRHLVSIVMFGRVEYQRPLDTTGVSNLTAMSTQLQQGGSSNYQDFYRVVVTDMASAQWTTILEELKKDFRVFLRDVLLFKARGIHTHIDTSSSKSDSNRMKGRLSGALKGNVLEAINLAASQFSNDYIDRDLIRTGVSTVIITAGSGVFDVDRDLLKLTSETLTNNGIGIDVVCLSRMPLHSVPLFRYRLPESERRGSIAGMQAAASPSLSSTNSHPSLPDLSHSPAFSLPNSNSNYFLKFPSAFPARLPQEYAYGIPQWIDLSYWSSEMSNDRNKREIHRSILRQQRLRSGQLFVPRVRMYELQMMGLMEIGMADIAIPYLDEDLDGNKPTKPDDSPNISRAHRLPSPSQSPEIYRRGPSDVLRRRSKVNIYQDLPKSNASYTKLMDEYDESAFSVQVKKHGKPTVLRQQTPRKKEEVLSNTSAPVSKPSVPVIFPKSKLKHNTNVVDKSDNESIRSTLSKTARPRGPRNISYTFRGLAPLKASAATPELRVENINALKGLDAVSLTENHHESTSDPPGLDHLNQARGRASLDSDKNHEHHGTANAESGSRPIKIKSTTGVPRRKSNVISDDIVAARKVDGRLSGLDNFSNSSVGYESAPESLPQSTIPFVRNVNASNPLKGKLEAGIFGRWQHLYPRKPKAATVKWKSLCTPASVPLTIEDFPTGTDFTTNYEALCHVVRTSKDEDIQHDPRYDTYSLFLDMISLRIAHGYQFVVGNKAAATLEEELLDSHAIFNDEIREKSRMVVALAMGNAIQKLELHNSLSIRVTTYVLKSLDSRVITRPSMTYDLLVRTILSDGYLPRHMTLKSEFEQYPWQTADNHLAASSFKSARIIEDMRYWRARFVLIPVEPPAMTWKTVQADENEEEIHILGIRALTQAWQKNRFFTPQEKSVMQKRAASVRRQDINPLEVKMETLNPSELVTLELDRLSRVEENSDNSLTQLLSEPEKFDRETSMLQKLAHAMQSEQGLEIKNRRWHLRLYYNCFQGEEFTNWLMHNVKNMKSRDDAVEFGNQLMKEGLFEHVSDRHHFKDGHYFYSIKPEYRITKLDPQKSWFPNSRQSNKSIPPTSAPEPSSKELSPTPIRTRSGSNLVQQIQTQSQLLDSRLPGERKRKSVSLSKSIRVDVDPRKKSFLERPEVVEVCYDRFHNPENSYHIDLVWLNTTCKLVDDAITSWTNIAERYGLKLVEVPIAEACEVPKSEPFRNPYRIKLALEPPNTKLNPSSLNNTFYSTTSFTPYVTVGGSNQVKHVYQKAILKRSNFVLDLEAENEFPEGVDIEYSWGKLNYKHTQYVHRSGVVLAQIMDDGDIILLANRLYNSRLANTKDVTSRSTDQKRDIGPHSHRPAVPPSAAVSMQASGIVGVNLASPSTTFASSPSLAPFSSIDLLSSPRYRALNHAPTSSPLNDLNRSVIADSFGPKSKFAATGLWNALITPEQIKDDLESFCSDKARLERFYQEVSSTSLPTVTNTPGSGNRRANGSTGSTLLNPVREVPGAISDITGMPEFQLPEAVTAVKELKRATAPHDNHGEHSDRSTRARQGSGSSVARTDPEALGSEHGPNNVPSSLRKVSK